MGVPVSQVTVQPFYASGAEAAILPDAPERSEHEGCELSEFRVIGVDASTHTIGGASENRLPMKYPCVCIQKYQPVR